MCFPFCLSFWLHASVAVRFSHGPFSSSFWVSLLPFCSQNSWDMLGFTDVHPSMVPGIIGFNTSWTISLRPTSMESWYHLLSPTKPRRTGPQAPAWVRTSRRTLGIEHGTSNPTKRSSNDNWLVVYLPLWKILYSWDDDIPNIWKNNPFMFQTTKQIMLG